MGKHSDRAAIRSRILKIYCRFKDSFWPTAGGEAAVAIFSARRESRDANVAPYREWSDGTEPLARRLRKEQFY